ncbi:MAG: lipopolysaccharide biosynthesis protein [Candidatus Rokubacteria bacterium]|nr:lipopolysaccharide biosynthesis protein [Candidatus Rokubacteria bacterium]
MGQLLRFGVSLVLARLLAPEDFGLLGMAVVITGFVGLFQTLGTHGAVIQRKELSAAFVNSVATVNVAMGAALTCILVLAAPLVAHAYQNEAVAGIVRTLSFIFLISSFGIVHSSLLNRDLRFNRLVGIELTATAMQAVAAVTLASFGFKVWALVTGNLVAATVTMSLLQLASPWRVRWGVAWPELRGVWGFSLHLTGVNTLDYAFKNADKLVIATFLGPDALGYYWLAYSLCMLPADALTRILGRVLFAAFSRIQDDDAELRRAVLRTTGVTMVIVMPMMAGLAAVAGPFAAGALGDKWAPIAPLIVALVPIGVLTSLSAPTANLYLAKGKSHWLFWWNLTSGTVVVASVFAGVPWGLLGVAGAYAAVMIPLTAVFLLFPFRLIQLSMSELLRAMAPIATGTGFMVVLVVATRMALEAAGFRPLTVLALTVPVGPVAYGLAMLVLRPRAFGDLQRIVSRTS